ncbi:hypothetical protein [Lactiplantibacillus plantarum]|uniref:hypothetical protein n=1 Tax=Lactiplantibacillus plantarum TaxID=1590 RepID=UPI0018AD3AEB|nr:hypothetical protein [Lactiplantibacillus plantarum]MBS0939839.1 hypothetical protein [Lactiplantibacillus plantarum]WGF85469.1 hypothetical protein QB909_04345 [Lactiplantibacillus plantarum]WGG42794.1 hypothetical protein QCL57_04345 [Lactiplantibacillus plantarum]
MMKNFLVIQCETLLNNILRHYSNTAYMKKAKINNLDTVPEVIWDLWYSPFSASFVTIKRSDIKASNADTVQILKKLIWLKYSFFKEFSKL